MTPGDTIRFLYALQRFGIKSGLTTITRLLDSLGHPELGYPAIHIAGTNGKGSTSSIIASVLTAAGFRTGLYTSPHLIDFRERIRVNGRPIPPQALVRETRRLRALIRTTHATFFEATTAIAFEWFRQERVDVAVIETGLGGRLDATNVITPLVSVITNIGRDHMEYLGTTLRAIAREKAGIIKAGVPVVTGVADRDALEILRRTAARMRAPLIRAGEKGRVSMEAISADHSRVAIRMNSRTYRGIRFALPGRHQIGNLNLAMAALASLPPEFRKEIGAQALRRGLEELPALSGLRGRLETVRSNPLTIVDVAHNVPGVETAIRSLRELVPGKYLVVFGVMRDKEYESMLETISACARLIIAVRPATERALPGRRIVEILHAKGMRAVDGGEVASGIRLALGERREDESVLILGSHYVAGEALKFLNSSR